MNAERTNQTPRHTPAMLPAGGRGMRIADEHTARNDTTGDLTGDPKYDPIEEGSPITKPCARSAMSGTAIEPSASDDIKSANGADAPIRAGPVPLFLVPQTISSEIHAYGGDISEISVRRTRQHVYAITLTRTTRTEEGRTGNTRTGNARTGAATEDHAGRADRSRADAEGAEQAGEAHAA